jgi:hypothetical protein
MGAEVSVGSGVLVGAADEKIEHESMRIIAAARGHTGLNHFPAVGKRCSLFIFPS